MTGFDPVLIKNDYAGALRSVLRNSAGLTTVAGLKLWQVLGFLLLHIPLALLMRSMPSVATVHALGTLLLGLWCALFDRQRERVAYIAAYIVGSEVLWRMNESQSVWEFGKYATAAIFIAAMLRNGRVKFPLLPLIYFALLIPSIYLTAQGADFEKVRRQLSFNLSGAFALMVCCLFFSMQVFTTKQLHRLFLASIGPILGIAFLALGHAFTESSIIFTRGSNQALSGGWGPNQVSSVLGLGGLLAFFLTLASRLRPGVRFLMLLCSAFLFAQSVATFSRSGPYLGIGCALLASFYLLRDKVSRRKLLVSIGALAIAAVFVLPRLNAFTGGALAARYQDPSTTNRDLIVIADLEIWYANRIFGVGPGGSNPLHALTFRKQAAHTEYSRLLAEHGVFGLVAMILVLVIPLRNLMRARTPIGKALVAAMAGWALLYMLVNAMRLAAPAFCMGLTCATFLSHEEITLAIKQRLVNFVSRKGRGMVVPANRGA